MTRMDQFIQYRALARKFTYQNPTFNAVLDHAIETDQIPIPVQNVCAKLVVPLVERLDATLSILSMSKRQFIEMALVEALDRADAILKETGALEEPGLPVEDADHE